MVNTNVNTIGINGSFFFFFLLCSLISSLFQMEKIHPILRCSKEKRKKRKP